jgi:hypothetical protein
MVTFEQSGEAIQATVVERDRCENLRGGVDEAVREGDPDLRQEK